MYEDHKKNQSKPSEIQNPNRPISSYQRIMSAGSRQDEERVHTNPTIQNHHQLVQNLANQQANSIDKIIENLRDFIKSKNLKKEDLFESLSTYITLEEFKQVFKNISFEITKQDINALFTHNNSTYDEGFISGKIFLDNFNNMLNLESKQHSFTYEEMKVNTSINKSVKNKESNKSVINNNKFKEYTSEIMSIIKTQEEKDYESRKQKLQSARLPSKNPINKNKLAPLTATRRINPNIEKGQELQSGKSRDKQVTFRPKTSLQSGKQNKIKPRSAKEFMIETFRKKEAEEELIKLSIEKRNKEFERDCILKMSEANKICEKLKIPLSYTVYISEEQSGVLICRMYNKVLNSTADLDLKSFLFDYKKLKKQIKIKELKDSRAEIVPAVKKEEEVNITEQAIIDLTLLNRAKRQEVIKKVLKESILLKMQLKSQLKALREKEIIDKEIIDSNIRITNLNIEEI